MLLVVKLEAVGEGFVDVSLCGEVHDGVDSLRDQQVVHQIGARNVALHELEVLGCLRHPKLIPTEIFSNPKLVAN